MLLAGLVAKKCEQAVLFPAFFHWRQLTLCISVIQLRVLSGAGARSGTQAAQSGRHHPVHRRHEDPRQRQQTQRDESRPHR